MCSHILFADCHILVVASYLSVYWQVNLYLIVDTNCLSRSLYIARFWKKSLTPLIHLPDIEEYGWFADGRITWVIESYPKEVKEIMDDLYFENDNNYESDVDSGQAD